MNDPIVKLLDGTEMPKSQVPVDTIYINEKGLKVRKVNNTVAKPALGDELAKGALFANFKDLAQKKLPLLLKKIPYDKITAGLSSLQTSKGVNVQPVLNFVQSLSDSAQSGDMSGISNFIGGGADAGFDMTQVKNLVSSLNIPILNKVVDVVSGMFPHASPREQFNSYLKLALEDGVITEDEELKLNQLGKAAGLNKAEIAKIINTNIR